MGRSRGWCRGGGAGDAAVGSEVEPRGARSGRTQRGQPPLRSLLASMSFVAGAEDSDFPIQNLPYGVFSTPDNVSCCARPPGGGGGRRLGRDPPSPTPAPSGQERQPGWTASRRPLPDAPRGGPPAPGVTGARGSAERAPRRLRGHWRRESELGPYGGFCAVSRGASGAECRRVRTPLSRRALLDLWAAVSAGSRED